MTLSLVLTVLGVFVLLCVNEVWWRTRAQHGEASRKFIHSTVGAFVAFWPVYLSWNQIRFMSVAFLAVVVISQYFAVFPAIHDVPRSTWGEAFFAVAVGVTTFLTQDQWVYMAAILTMALADGLAAVVGVRFGSGNQYRVLGHVKSVAGTATFVVVALAILIGYREASGASLSVPAMVGLSLAGAAVENVAVLGLDNLAVPLLVAGVLTLLT